MVTFHEDKTPSENQLASKLHAQIKESLDLSEKLKEVDAKIRTTPAFIKKVGIILLFLQTGNPKLFVLDYQFFAKRRRGVSGCP